MVGGYGATRKTGAHMKATVELCERQLDRTMAFFPRVDAKATALFAIDSGLLAVMGTHIRADQIGLWYAFLPAVLATAVGIDVGDVRAVRAGIRANNDLVWIGKAASMAAKLSDCREYPYTTFISSRTYAKLRDSSKLSQGKNMWESGTFTFGGVKETVYRSSWWRRP